MILLALYVTVTSMAASVFFGCALASFFLLKDIDDKDRWLAEYREMRRLLRVFFMSPVWPVLIIVYFFKFVNQTIAVRLKTKEFRNEH